MLENYKFHLRFSSFQSGVLLLYPSGLSCGVDIYLIKTESLKTESLYLKVYLPLCVDWIIQFPHRHRSNTNTTWKYIFRVPLKVIGLMNITQIIKIRRMPMVPMAIKGRSFQVLFTLAPCLNSLFVLLIFSSISLQCPFLSVQIDCK